MYTTHEVAQKLGLTVRALHYYDQIGLLRPSGRGDNNYRLYAAADVLRGQQIAYFRAIGLRLDQIKTLIDNPGFNVTDALTDQHRYISLEINRLHRLKQLIEDELFTQNGVTMTNQTHDEFTDEQMDQLKEEARQKWGQTAAWRQSQARTRHWTRDDYRRIAEDGKKFTQTIADQMIAGTDPKDPAVQALMVQHLQGINTFYDCTIEMYRGLSQMYVDDPRFQAYYEKFAPGLAAYMQKAMNYFTDTQPEAFRPVTTT